MAADPTLVDLAYKESLSKNPEFDIDVTKQKLKTAGPSWSDPVLKALKAKLKETAKNANNNLKDGPISPDILTSTEKELQRLKKEFLKDLEKELKAEAAIIKAEMNGIKNQTIELRTNLMELGNLVENGDISSTTSQEDIENLNEALSLPEGGGGGTSYKDGKLHIGNNPASDIGKGIIPIPKKMEGDLLALVPKENEEFDVDMNAGAVINIIGDDKDAAGHIFQTPQQGNPVKGYNVPGGSTGTWQPGSWANALEAHPALAIDTTKNIIGDLIKNDNLSRNSVDTNKDGIISPEEYKAVMSSENRDMIIDVLVNPKNPLYDHDLSVREYADFTSKQNEILANKNKPATIEEKQRIFEMSKTYGDDPRFQEYANRRFGGPTSFGDGKSSTNLPSNSDLAIELTKKYGNQ